MITYYHKQSGSVLVMAMLITLVIALIITSVYKMQSASIKKNEISTRESKEDAAISYCYALATNKVSTEVSAITTPFDLIKSATSASPAILSECVLMEGDFQLDETKSNNCSPGFPASYKYKLNAVVKFPDGVIYRTISIVTDDPCV